MNQNIKVLKDKVYLTEEFEHADDIVEFVTNKFGVKYTGALEFNINYYHEKDGIEYEITKFKVQWGSISTPVIRNGHIYVEVPIIALEDKPSKMSLAKFVSTKDGEEPVKTVKDVVDLRDWLIAQARKFVTFKGTSFVTNVNLNVGGTSIYRALDLANLQRFTKKKFILTERKKDIEIALSDLVVNLTKSSLDIQDDRLDFDICLNDFKFLVNKEDDLWVDWDTMKTFRSVKPLSELVEKIVKSYY